MSFVESTRADIVAWMAGLSCIRVWTIGREKTDCRRAGKFTGCILEFKQHSAAR